MSDKTPKNESTRRAGVAQARVSSRDVLIAARRHFDQGETLASIAEDLGISGSYLGRLLRSARENGWVRIEVAADPETELAARLHEKLPHMVHIEVVAPGDTPMATARSVGMAGARWLNALLERDEETKRFAIQNIAIGGAVPHAVIVEQTLPRRNRISVGPTALTPERGKVERFTASTLSALLGLRLSALGPGDRLPAPAERQGFRYALSIDPPDGNLDTMTAWFASLHQRPEFLEVTSFWKRLDVAFVSAVGVDAVYGDVRRRLGALGTSVEDLKRRGALAVVANQFVTAAGEPLDLAPGLSSYEPAIPVENLTLMGKAGKFVVLDLWGNLAFDVVPLARSPIANVLLCDTMVANTLLQHSV